MWPSLAKAITDASRGRGSCTVLLAGHSLGAAQAILAADRVGRALQLPVAGVYAFGCPMVGNPIFTQSVNFPVHRIEADSDVVPFLPPPPNVIHAFADGIARGVNFATSAFYSFLTTIGATEIEPPPVVASDVEAYRHIGTRTFLTNAEFATTHGALWKDELLETYRAIRAGARTISDGVLHHLVSDHLMESYKNVIRKNYDKLHN